MTTPRAAPFNANTPLVDRYGRLTVIGEQWFNDIYNALFDPNVGVVARTAHITGQAQAVQDAVDSLAGIDTVDLASVEGVQTTLNELLGSLRAAGVIEDGTV